jgi:predicted transcriptional regulator
MKTFKTRHQLFLPDDMSKRLDHLAKSSGRARSEILVEALDAWFNNRAAPKTDEAIGIRLARIERNTEVLRRNLGIFWEAYALMLRHQLINTAGLPAPQEAEMAKAGKQFTDFIDGIADRLAGKAPPPGAAITEKLRRLI